MRVELGLEAPPVAGAGQRVVVGQPGQPLEVGAPLGDVGRDADEAGRLAVGAALGGDGQGGRDVGAVLAHERPVARLGAVLEHGRREHRQPGAHAQLGGALGDLLVEVEEQQAVGADDLVLAIAQEPLGADVEDRDLAVEVDGHDGRLGGRAEHAGEAVARLGQRPLGLHLGRDVHGHAVDHEAAVHRPARPVAPAHVADAPVRPDQAVDEVDVLAAAQALERDLVEAAVVGVDGAVPGVGQRVDVAGEARVEAQHGDGAARREEEAPAAAGQQLIGVVRLVDGLGHALDRLARLGEAGLDGPARPHVGERADVADHGARRVAARGRVRRHPGDAPVGAVDARLALERPAAGDGRLPGREHDLGVIRMHGIEPAGAERALGRQPRQLAVAGVDPEAAAVRVRLEDAHRSVLDEVARRSGPAALLRRRGPARQAAPERADHTPAIGSERAPL